MKKTASKIIILKMLFFLNYINKYVKKMFTLDFEEPKELEKSSFLCYYVFVKGT